MSRPRPPIVIARSGVIRDAMHKKGMSVRALAALAGVSKSTVANLATKTDYGIAKDKASAIAHAVDVPLSRGFVHRDGAPLT